MRDTSGTNGKKGTVRSEERHVNVNKRHQKSEGVLPLVVLLSRNKKRKKKDRLVDSN